MFRVDPSFLKLWHAWIRWWHDVPYWDPWGAAITLIAVGFLSGYFVYKLLHTRPN